MTGMVLQPSGLQMVVGLVIVLGHGSVNGYVWARCHQAIAYSVYLSPKYSAREYRDRLNALEDSLRGVPGRFIVVGDFNVHAVEWGMPVINTRGRLILKMCSRIDLEVANRSSKLTVAGLVTAIHLGPLIWPSCV